MICVYCFIRGNVSMFLPVSKADMKARCLNQLDFILISGDAYVDHSSFAHAVIGRVLESHGYSVGIIPQPDWQTANDFKKLGTPRLGFLVCAGNMDSMVNHYTVSKKRRKQDFYSPGGKAGLRPDRATIVYCNKLREAFGKKIPIIIGGIEASLRRFAHYDYWSDKVRRSILIDSGADILVFGMGERQIVEIADLLSCGASIKDIKHIAGTVYEETEENLPKDCIILPDFDTVSTDKKEYAVATAKMSKEQDYVRGKVLAQKDNKKYIVQNPPAPPLSQGELDSVYELPYENTYHPMYERLGGIPAISEIKFSLTSSRGCFGNCNFCALAFHQGRTVTARSHTSLIKEAECMTS
ncbi:MAG: YgiQ family radical SAM protein, partial [Clostridia bacterium]|nr:YgiQ family radical SAM protein [Clostridia bacterium]